jgi:hypothetical protein
MLHVRLQTLLAIACVSACGSNGTHSAPDASAPADGGDSGVGPSDGGDATVAPGPYDWVCPPKLGSRALFSSGDASGLVHDADAVYWTFHNTPSRPAGIVVRARFDGAVSQLATMDTETPMALRPQGSALYWLATADDTGGVTRLLRKAIDGSGPTAFDELATSLSTAPDGAFRVVGAGANVWLGNHDQILRLPLTGAAPERIADAAFPPIALAVDGARVVWLSLYGIHSVPIGGGPVRDLWLGQDHVRPPKLALDANFAYFVDQESLVRVPLAGGTPTLVAAKPGDFRVEADELYWVSSTENEVRRLRPDLSAPEVVLPAGVSDAPVQEMVVANGEIFWIEVRTDGPTPTTFCVMRRALPPRLPTGDAGAAETGGLDAADAADATVVPATSHGTGGAFQWGLQTTMGFNAIAMHPSGDVVVAGSLGAPFDLGGGTLSPVGKGDAVLARFDPTGKHVSSRRFGLSGNTMPWALDVDGVGNAVMFGYFTGEVDFGGPKLTSTGGTVPQPFLVKLDGAGAHVWSKRLFELTASYSPYQMPLAVGTDAAGNVIAAGRYGGSPVTIDFGDGGRTSPYGGNYVVKLDPNGALLWARTLDMPTGISAMSVDRAGAITVAGNFSATAVFGATTLISNGGNDAYVARLDASGTWQWARRFGSAGTDTAWALAVDGSGKVFVDADFHDAIDFGGGPVSTCSLCERGAVAALDASGSHLWSHAFASVDDRSDVMGRAMRVDPSGAVLLGGVFARTADFGGGMHQAPGTDIGKGAGFLTKVDSTGKFLWSKSTDSLGGVNGLAVDPTGSTYTIGYFSGSLGLGSSLIAAPSSTTSTGFLIKLGP